jgi:adenine-specific DNA methylase
MRYIGGKEKLLNFINGVILEKNINKNSTNLLR